MDHFRIAHDSQGHRWTPSWKPVLLTALFVASSLGALALLPSPAHAGAPTPAPAAVVPMARSGPLATHGDLVVGPTNSPLVISPSLTGSAVYFQQGNITVLPGGVLTFQNTDVVISQFIGETGSVAQRYAHLYHISDQGSLTFVNSSLSTDFASLNAFPKLTVTVSGGGGMFVDHSQLLFPGAIDVVGSNSDLAVNNSTVSAGPTAAIGNATNATQGDIQYAPTLSVSGGARAAFGASQYLNYYADDLALNGVPAAPVVTDSTAQSLTGTGGATWSAFAVPSDPETLAQAALYPTVRSATLTVNYDASAATTTTGANSFSFLAAHNFPGSLSFSAGPGALQVSLPAATIAEIDSAGVPAFLSALDAGTASLTLSAVSGGATVAVSSVSLALTPMVQYNYLVSGAGSTLTVADSTFDLNWANTTSAALWNSTKILLDQGAVGDFASMSATAAYPGGFGQSSAVIPDATSTANFYRWLAVQVLGAGSTPVADAQLVAFYQYSANQSANGTATAMNNLAAAAPDLWAYVNSPAATTGIPGYGSSGADGFARVLLASTRLVNASMPDGDFVGDYHAAVSLAGGGASSVRWFSASVTPYPLAMTPAGWDVQQPISYSNYVPTLSVGTINVTVNGTPSSPASVPIGQTLAADVTVMSIGSAPVNTVTVSFWYADPYSFQLVKVAPNVTVGPLAVGEDRVVNFSWMVNQSVVGLHGTFNTSFVVLATWNLGIAPTGGNATGSVAATIEPALIQFHFTPPAGTVTPSTTQTYPASALANWSGNGSALLNVTATGPSGRFRLLTIDILDNTTVPLSLFFPLAMGPGAYAINATVFFNGRTVALNFPDQITVPTPTTPAPPFYLQSLLGLPVWLWIVIALAIVGGVLAFMFVARRTAKGKVVECGECGNLIPENATACPKCGAEFEVDLVRCSRCGSTIPASSEVCPECSAVLLAKGGASESDPERQGYADFVERFRAEAKKELGDNYGEGAFWDWWKRQPTYVSFNQWKLSQAQGTRTGMAAPPSAAPAAPPASPKPPRGGGGGGAATATPRARTAAAPARPAPRAAPVSPPTAEPAAEEETEPDTGAPPAGAEGPSAPMKACSNCGKEIPPDFLVCPFCGAVSR